MSPSTTSKRVRRVLVGVLILAAGIGGAFVLVKTKPKAERRPRPVLTPLVEAVELRPITTSVTVRCMGLVIPDVEIDLQVQVSGTVTAKHPQWIEGGLVRRDEVLVELDDRDYRHAARQRQAALAQAQCDVRLEEGRQDIARHEWSVVGNTNQADALTRELALRVPQLNRTQAAVDLATAQSDQAALNLARTQVRAPFDAVLQSVAIDVGDQAAPGRPLAHLVGIDRFLVRVAVPVDEVRWLAFPPANTERGAAVRVRLTDGQERTGHLLKLVPDLESRGRMARVLVALDAPLASAPGEGARPVLLGEYAHVAITGKTTDNVYAIPRAALRDGDVVWLLDGEGRLVIEPAKIEHKEMDTVLICAGWAPDLRLIVSDLSTPVAGMRLRTTDDPAPPAGPPDGTGAAPGGRP